MKISLSTTCIYSLALLPFLFSGYKVNAQTTDGNNPPSILGTWILSVSETSPGTAPDEQLSAWSLTFTKATKHWLTWNTELTANGMDKPIHFGWNGPTNGKPQPLIGVPGSEAYHWDGHTLIRDADHGHGETKHDTVVLSADGNTLVITDTTTTPSGEAVAHQVLHRQR
jgi:hypothetical protein